MIQSRYPKENSGVRFADKVCFSRMMGHARYVNANSLDPIRYLSNNVDTSASRIKSVTRLYSFGRECWKGWMTGVDIGGEPKTSDGMINPLVLVASVGGDGNTLGPASLMSGWLLGLIHGE